jgi:phospholipid/cholesterol/gamma-HCH transport system substrate-binding protein
MHKLMHRLMLVGVVAALAVGTTGILAGNDDGYEVDVVIASATNLAPGSGVFVEGHEAGHITGITVDGGRARLTMELDDAFAPLHSGARVGVEWRSLIGERRVVVADGPEKAAEIPEGGMVQGVMPQPMEFDQLLAALDKPTRERLSSMLTRMDHTLNGNEANLHATLREAGPALQEIGSFLRGLGTDGRSIKTLVTELEQMITILARREDEVQTIVDGFSAMSRDMATQQRDISASIERWPGVLRQAKTTLDRVPGTADEVIPLLQDLEPATARLPRVASNLKPVLQDLRPMTRQMRPTLASMERLLGYTPAMLDSAHGMLPGLRRTARNVKPAWDFWRPYTPELAGVITNWNSALGNYDSKGRYVRNFETWGAATLDANPGVMPPGFWSNPTPLPGEQVDQPWTDANGSGKQ